MASDVSPRPRTRVIVDPPPRVRVQPVAAVTPPPRVRAVPRKAAGDNWSDIIPGHLPLPFTRQTHNGYSPQTGELPDPRFAPLVIVMNPMWLDNPPGNITYLIGEALKWTPDQCFPSTPLYGIPAWVYEHALRKYTGKALLRDDVFAALEGSIIERADLQPPDPMAWNDAQRSMLKVQNMHLQADMTKAAGPFYLDGVILIEHVYAKMLRPVSA